MTDNRVSQPITAPSQSTDSYGRTDGLTDTSSPNPDRSSFSNAPRTSETTTDQGVEALYRIFDAESQLLYVGRSRQWPTRMGQHEAGKDWWPDVARIDVEWHAASEIGLAEMLAIYNEQPRYNIAYQPKRAKKPTGPGPFTGLLCVMCCDPIGPRQVFFWLDGGGQACSPCTQEHDLYGEIEMRNRVRPGAVA